MMRHGARARLAILLFVAWARVAGAQVATAPLSGVVVDARTQLPLAGAQVEVSSPPQVALTDAEGRFRFDAVPVGPQELLVSLIGYGFRRVPVSVAAEGSSVTVPLAEGAAAFTETVKVEGDSLATRDIGVAGQQWLGSDELRQLGGMTLGDPLRAVQALAGVNASDDFYGEMAVRGHGFSDLNYTLDGAPANFLLHTLKFVEDGASVTMVNGDVLDHAALLRGAYPQRFNQRIGAALDFASSAGSRERTRYNVTASGTSASLTADGPFGSSARGSWLVSVRRSYLDLFLKHVLDDSSLAFGFTDLFSSAAYDLTARDQVQVTVIAGRSRFDQPTNAASPLNLARAEHGGWLASAGWRRTGTAWMLAQRFFASGETFDNHDGRQAQVATGDGSDIGYRADASVSAGRSLIEAGGSIERVGTRQQLAVRVPGWHVVGGEDFSAHAARVGAYAQVRGTVGPVTLTPGVRVEHFGLTGDWTASPWIQSSWQVSPGLAVLVNAGRHQQFPDFAEVVGRRGDNDLRPQRADHIDAGVDARLSEATHLLVTAYASEERNRVDLPGQYHQLVNGRVVEPSASTRYANRLDGSSRGIELMLRRRTPDSLSGWISYSFGRRRHTDTVTGEVFDADFDQRHTVNVFARYRFSERMSGSVRWRYGSNRPITGYVEERDGLYFVGERRNAARVPVYTRLDARLDRTYRWQSRRITLFAEVANILNRDNFRQEPSSIDPASGRVLAPLDTMFPIVPSIGVTVEF